MKMLKTNDIIEILLREALGRPAAAVTGSGNGATFPDAAGGQCPDYDYPTIAEELASLPVEAWKEVIDVTAQQGVAAIAVTGLQCLYDRFDSQTIPVQAPADEAPTEQPTPAAPADEAPTEQPTPAAPADEAPTERPDPADEAPTEQPTPAAPADEDSLVRPARRPWQTVLDLDENEDLRYDWFGHQLSYELDRESHEKVLKKFARMLEGDGIRMMLLKGYGLSFNYPLPEQRPSGDIDCYLFGDGDRADSLVEAAGVKVSRENRKHSTFKLKGKPVENHKSFLDIGTSKVDRRFETQLRALVARGLAAEATSDHDVGNASGTNAGNASGPDVPTTSGTNAGNASGLDVPTTSGSNAGNASGPDVPTTSGLDAEATSDHDAPAAGERFGGLDLDGVHIVLPSPQMNYVFLLRHMVKHWAIYTSITLRHLLDWGLFLRHYGDSVDLPSAHRLIVSTDQAVIHDVFTVLAGRLTGDDLSRFCIGLLPPEPLLDKVLSEICAFKQDMPSRGFAQVLFRARNFRAQRWKHALVGESHLTWAFGSLSNVIRDQFRR